MSATLITQAKEEREASVLANVPINEYGLPDLSNVPAKYLTFEEVPVERVTLYGWPYEKIDKFLTYNGVKYIRMHTMMKFTSAVPRPDIYNFAGKKVGDKRIFSLQKKNPDTGEWVEIVSNIPYTKTWDNDNYIPYDYYVNTLMPLMEETE